MKKLILSCLLLLAGIGSSKLYAQEHSYGYFNSVAVGLNVGTTGIGFDVATPIGNYLALRAGVDFMPGFSMNGDVDISGEVDGEPYNGTLNAEGTLKRTSGNLLLNVYPFKSSSFFVAAGDISVATNWYNSQDIPMICRMEVIMALKLETIPFQ